MCIIHGVYADDQGDAEVGPCVRQHNVVDSSGWARMDLAAAARHCAGHAVSEKAAVDACRRELAEEAAAVLGPDAAAGDTGSGEAEDEGVVEEPGSEWENGQHCVDGVVTAAVGGDDRDDLEPPSWRPSLAVRWEALPVSDHGRRWAPAGAHQSHKRNS